MTVRPFSVQEISRLYGKLYLEASVFCMEVAQGMILFRKSHNTAGTNTMPRFIGDW